MTAGSWALVHVGDEVKAASPLRFFFSNLQPVTVAYKAKQTTAPGEPGLRIPTESRPIKLYDIIICEN
jgi:hypothetical protein